VSGSVIEDTSIMSAPEGCTRDGVGTHHSTTSEQRMVCHYLAHECSVVLIVRLLEALSPRTRFGLNQGQCPSRLRAREQ
jgi:hypothetical protein